MLLFNSVADAHAPVRRIAVRANPAPWLDTELREAMAMRDDAKSAADLYGLHSDIAVYKKLRNYVVKLNRKKKEHYFKTKMAENSKDPKHVWKLTNLLLGRTKGSGPACVELNGQYIVKPRGIANYFSDYYTKIKNHVIYLDVRDVADADTGNQISFRIFSSNRWTDWFEIPGSFSRGTTKTADIGPAFFGNFGTPDKIELKTSGTDWLALNEVFKLGGVSFAVKVSTELYEICDVLT
ncbi:hypothetical protein Bbelb_361690 [Branchiostoma belcheri]|nr:hypothetical protein Bbelb_361690 [Branchiostoma belcheri]